MKKIFFVVALMLATTSAKAQTPIEPLMAPHPSMEQLKAIISDPRVSPELKMMVYQQAQGLMQVQIIKVPGGTWRIIPGTGQKQFIPD